MKFVVIITLIIIASFTVPLISNYSKSLVTANLKNTFHLSMPVENINYTVTDVNGLLCAKIDGYYPIKIQSTLISNILPMLYPMPPNSSNINVTLNTKSLEWNNYTSAYPEVLHKTSIGDWWMIYCVLENVSSSFLLEIHYEHPLEKINGSYLFLYDLNIIDYLSDENPISTAYFTIRFETEVTDIHVYTASAESTPSQWQPKDFTVSHEGSVCTVSVEIQSEYATDLPGDLVVMFSDENHNEIAPQTSDVAWALIVIISSILILIILCVIQKRVSPFLSSRKTAT